MYTGDNHWDIVRPQKTEDVFSAGGKYGNTSRYLGIAFECLRVYGDRILVKPFLKSKDRGHLASNLCDLSCGDSGKGPETVLLNGGFNCNSNDEHRSHLTIGIA